MVCLLQEPLLPKGGRVNKMNNTTTNQTAEDTITETLLNLLGTNQEALLVVGIAVAAGSLAYYRVPKVREVANKYLPMVYIRALTAKFLKRHGAEVDALINANLTKLQMLAFETLDAQLQKQVQDEVLRNVILSAYDQYDDKLKKQVRNDIRSALAKARGEAK